MHTRSGARRRSARAFLAALAAPLLLGLLAGCGEPGARGPEALASPERINRTTCAGCHAPREPGERGRADLEPVLQKHRAERRAKLSDDEWHRLTDYLAKR